MRKATQLTWCTVQCFSFGFKPSSFCFFNELLLLVCSESPLLARNLKVNLLLSSWLQTKRRPCKSASVPGIQTHLELRWLTPAQLTIQPPEAESGEKIRVFRFNKHYLLASSEDRRTARPRRARFIGTFTRRVDKKHLICFRRGSSLPRCLNTIQSPLLSIHFKSEPAGYAEITAARLAEQTLFN